MLARSLKEVIPVFLLPDRFARLPRKLQVVDAFDDLILQGIHPG